MGRRADQRPLPGGGDGDQVRGVSRARPGLSRLRRRGGARGRPGTPVALGPTFAGLIIALQSVAITYGGWQSALYFTEEDRDPRRNLPRAMIGGVVAVIVVYLLVNIALLVVLPVPAIAHSTLPAADAAQIVLGGYGRQIITVLSLISLPPLSTRS